MNRKTAKPEINLQALTIYLLRDLPDPEKAISGSSQKLVIDPNHTVYVKRKKAHHPSWAAFFGNRVDPDEFGKVRSVGALAATATSPTGGRSNSSTWQQRDGEMITRRRRVLQPARRLLSGASFCPRTSEDSPGASSDRAGVRRRLHLPGAAANRLWVCSRSTQ
jgi:hypothetical protein